MWEKKGLREAKLDICSRRPVQPVSAMRGGVVTELSALKDRAWGGAGLGEGRLTGAGGVEIGKLEVKGAREKRRMGRIGGEGFGRQSLKRVGVSKARGSSGKVRMEG